MTLQTSLLALNMTAIPEKMKVMEQVNKNLVQTAQRLIVPEEMNGGAIAYMLKKSTQDASFIYHIQ